MVDSPQPPGLAISPRAVPAPAAPEETLFEGAPALVPSLGALLFAILTVGIGLAYLWWRRGGTHYRVTTQRIVIDRGLFGRTLDQTDLYRVTDFVVERPFGQRLLGTGNLRLRTMDKDSPEVELRAVKGDVVALYEKLRVAVATSKSHRAVHLVENE